MFIIESLKHGKFRQAFIIFVMVGQLIACNLCYAKLPETLLQSIPSKKMVIYKPAVSKAYVWIFTDLQCGYCVKQHNEIKDLLEQGIEVRYLAYPRYGIGSESYNKMVAIWCARDPKEAMSHSMRGEPVEITTCQHPIVEQMNLAKQLGIRGTPTIIFSDGTISGGYIPASSLTALAIKHSSRD